MGSKSSSYVSTVENVDNSSTNGLATTRGDGNSVNILDNGAIEKVFQFADRTSEGQAKSIGDVLNTFTTLASKTLDGAYKSGQAAVDAVNQNADTTAKRLSETTNGLNNAISNAYNSAQNNGYDPQKIVVGVFLLVAFIMYKK
jgi:hypothetical protein